MSIEVISIKIRRQIFDWTSVDNATSVSFDVTEMLRDIKRGTLAYGRVISPLGKDWADEWLWPHRDINMDRVLAVSKNSQLLNAPVLGVMMDPKQEFGEGMDCTLIDGSHRYATRLLLGLTDIMWHVVRFNDWQPYATITGKWPL